MTDQREYVFTEATDEERRLQLQGRVLDPQTRRVFDAAGLAPGMRVLDLGSGAGNVALLAAEFVGPSGSVMGIDSDPDAIARVETLVRNRGITNVEFRERDLYDLDGIDDEFDAVVGRAVFMHLAEPVRALQESMAKLRPGGLVCMHEADITYDWARPSTPLWEQVRTWTQEALVQGGVDMRMGLALSSVFQDAGLPRPQQMLEAYLGAGDESPAFGWANVVGGLLPLIEALGIATEDEVGLDTLTERLDAEVEARGGYVLSPLMIGAWTRRDP